MSWLSRRAMRHNGLHGSVSMAQIAMEQVLSIDSTTHEAKQIAANIRPLLSDLKIALKIRVD